MRANIGLSKQRKAKGAYAKALTPRVAYIKAPHVFHGTRGEVIVPASSTVRERFFNFSPRFLYSSAYMRAGIIIDKYWSHPIILEAMEVPTVVVIKLPVDFANFIKLSTITRKKPAVSRIPPKLMAIKIKEIVHIIASIPPLFNRLSKISMPVDVLYP